MSIRFEPTPFAPSVALRVEPVRDLQAARRFPAQAAPALLAAGSAEAGRDALLSGKALAVTTGQQAGLFTGPLFAVHKALTAAALAEEFARRWRRVVVPVFWVAGDDHDFGEINHCHVLAAAGDLATITLRHRLPDAPMLPAYRELLGTDVDGALRALEVALPASEFRPAALAWLEDAYDPERSLAEANARALATLLAPYGVVVARSWEVEIKRAAASIMVRALRGARSLDEALAAEAARLRASGADVPVAVGDGMSLVMIEGRSGRDRLRLAGDGTLATRRGGEGFALAELERIAEVEPARLSGNVLLRPAVEAHLFPTVAYVAGPGEFSYLAQNGPVFDFLSVARPVAVPRLSGFLIEAKVDKVLERFDLVPGDLARPEGELAARVVRDALPGPVRSALDDLRAALSEGFATLTREAVGIDATLGRTVESARNQALASTHEIEKKLVSHLKRANNTVLAQVARARTSLFPDGRPQERMVTVVSYLARYGNALMDTLLEAARVHARRLLEAPRSQA